MAQIPLGFRLLLLIGISMALPLLENPGDADERPPFYNKLHDDDDDDTVEIIAQNPGPDEDDSGEDFVPSHPYFKLPLNDDEDTVEIIAQNPGPDEDDSGEDFVPSHPYFKLPLNDDEDTVEIVAHPNPDEDDSGDDFVPSHPYFKLPPQNDDDTVEIIADNSVPPESEEDAEDFVPKHPYFKLPLDDDEDTVVIDASNEVDPSGSTGDGDIEAEPDFVDYFRSVAAIVSNAPAKPNHESGKILAKWSEDTGVNAEEVGKYFEGDIIAPKKLGRNGLSAPSARWPDGIIPFVIDNSFSPHDLNIIEDAFREYHKHTCIRFRRHTNERDYIKITKENTGCWSSVGRIGGMQEVNLQVPGCLTKIGTPIHELMHAAGFMHEQNRWERDDYVTIYWQNIEDGRNNNFDKAERGATHGHGVEYDYDSVMHYSDKSFSKNNQPTIVPKRSGVTVGQRDGFSRGDIAKLRNMYGCGTHRQPSFLEALFG